MPTRAAQLRVEEQVLYLRGRVQGPGSRIGSMQARFPSDFVLVSGAASDLGGSHSKSHKPVKPFLVHLAFRDFGAHLLDLVRIHKDLASKEGTLGQSISLHPFKTPIFL